MMDYIYNEKIAKDAINSLNKDMSEQNLWNCVVAHQNYAFYTATGLQFSYYLKPGKNGKVTKELIIDRRQDSKSLSWSSVRLAFEKILESDRYFERPKAIGDIRGISYVYSMFYSFGLIEVPDKYSAKMALN